MTDAAPTSTGASKGGVAVSIVGGSGLVGGHILANLAAHPRISTIHSFSRKQLTVDAASTATLEQHVDAASADWPAAVPSGPEIFFSALGTTRANAGGFDKQRKIDLDLNVAMAEAARAAGAKVYVLVSSHGADTGSLSGYLKMKGELNAAVAAMGFDRVVLLKPGLIVGDRQESRPAEAVVRSIAKGVGRISNVFADFWAQDADVIGRAAIAAGLAALDGKAPGSGPAWDINQSDIIRLGRTEWAEHRDAKS